MAWVGGDRDVAGIRGVRNPCLHRTSAARSTARIGLAELGAAPLRPYARHPAGMARQRVLRISLSRGAGVDGSAGDQCSTGAMVVRTLELRGRSARVDVSAGWIQPAPRMG